MKRRVFSLLAALVVGGAVNGFCAGAAEAAGATEQAVLNNIMTRSSVRSYTSKPVEKAKIEKLLRAGMAAPTGMNKQPWEFVVITDQELLSQLPQVAGGMRMAANAPLAIVVLGDERISGSWILDCSAATENILLAAHAMGLGAVWCGVQPNNETNRVAKMKELLELPDGVNALNAIIIGYPDKEPQIKDKWRPEKVHYNGYKK